MIFGNKDKFGIECTNIRTIYDAQIKWCYGKINFWANSLKIGDDDIEETINSIIVGLKKIYSYKNNRSSDNLYSLDSLTALNNVYNALYNDDNRSIEQINIDSDYYIKFITIPVGFDTFIYWKAILIEKDNISRYIWNYKNMEINEILLNHGEFDQIINDCIVWLEYLIV